MTLKRLKGSVCILQYFTQKMFPKIMVREIQRIL